MAMDSILAGSAQVVVAGGMESMSGAPYLLHKARVGYQVGHGELTDSLIKDGLWDAYGNKHMGSCAELCASKYLFNRDQQDDFAVHSYAKALKAQQSGVFNDEMIPIELKAHGHKVHIHEDERPKRFNEAKLRRLSPAFQPDGTITAGNATGMNDGASAMVVLSETRAEALGIQPLARILGFTQKSMAPEWFTIAPIIAIQALLAKLRMQASDFDLFEINEAFAPVPLAAIKDLDLPAEQVNVHGGAIALGHPLGASGARVLTTLIHALKRAGGKRGIASLCIGGGGGVAMAVELY
jgi:acetyl-CoA C-acetyltransferase